MYTIITMNTINIYIRMEKIKKRISQNTITLFLIIIYIYLILGYYGYFRYYKPRNLDRARLSDNTIGNTHNTIGEKNEEEEAK